MTFVIGLYDLCIKEMSLSFNNKHHLGTFYFSNEYIL